MSDGLDFAVSVLGLLLIATGLAKFDGWRRWKRTSRRLIYDRRLGKLATTAIPMAEIVAGALILVWPGVGLALATLILVVFGFGVLALLRTHAGEDCGCFGALAPSKISAALIVRNLVLAAIMLGFAAASWQQKPGSVSFEAMWVSGFVLVLALAAAEFLPMRKAGLNV